MTGQLTLVAVTVQVLEVPSSVTATEDVFTPVPPSLRLALTVVDPELIVPVGARLVMEGAVVSAGVPTVNVAVSSETPPPQSDMLWDQA